MQCPDVCADRRHLFINNQYFSTQILIAINIQYVNPIMAQKQFAAAIWSVCPPNLCCCKQKTNKRLLLFYCLSIVLLFNGSRVVCFVIKRVLSSIVLSFNGGRVLITLLNRSIENRLQWMAWGL